MPIRYADLLSLCGGGAAIVEHIPEPLLRELWIETKVARWLKEELRSGERHVFLTGSAGDGKTTLMRRLSEQTRGGRFCHIEDASIYDPKLLAARLGDALKDKKRLFVSVNYGVLRALKSAVDQLIADRQGGGEATRGTSGAPLEELQALLSGADLQAQQRSHWSEGEEEKANVGRVVCVNLGWQDLAPDGKLSDAEDQVESCLMVALKKASRADLAGCAEETKQAFNAIKAQLAQEHIRSGVLWLLRVAINRGRSISMRQLWAFTAHIFTGGRLPDDRTPLSWRDSLAARLWTPPSDLTLPFWDAILLAPLKHNDAFAKNLSLDPQAALQEVGFHISDDLPSGVVALLQYNLINKIGGTEEYSIFKTIKDALSEQKATGKPPEYAKGLLIKLLYKLLNRQEVHNLYPVWHSLAFTVRGRAEAPYVATHRLDVDQIELHEVTPIRFLREEVFGGEVYISNIHLSVIFDKTRQSLLINEAICDVLDVVGSTFTNTNIPIYEHYKDMISSWLTRVPQIEFKDSTTNKVIYFMRRHSRKFYAMNLSENHIKFV